MMECHTRGSEGKEGCFSEENGRFRGRGKAPRRHKTLTATEKG